MHRTERQVLFRAKGRQTDGAFHPPMYITTRDTDTVGKYSTEDGLEEVTEDKLKTVHSEVYIGLFRLWVHPACLPWPGRVSRAFELQIISDNVPEDPSLTKNIR